MPGVIRSIKIWVESPSTLFNLLNCELCVACKYVYCVLACFMMMNLFLLSDRMRVHFAQAVVVWVSPTKLSFELTVYCVDSVHSVRS